MSAEPQCAGSRKPHDLPLTLDPANVTALNNRGCALQNLGQPLEAIASFDKAVALAPGSVEALVNRGSVRGVLRRYTDAAADFKKHVLGIDPKLPLCVRQFGPYRMNACDWRPPRSRQDGCCGEPSASWRKRVIYPFINVALSHSMADRLQCARL